MHHKSASYPVERSSLIIQKPPKLDHNRY